MKKMKTSNKALLWILVVFLTGVLFGGTLTYLVYQPHRAPWADHKSGEKRSPDKFLQMISDELELDETQREQFRTLLIESRDQLIESRDKYSEARREIQKETRQKLRSILRPDQLDRFDKFMAKSPPHHPLGRERKPEK